MAFPISWTDLTSTSESSPRTVQLQNRGGDVYLIIHHAYNRVVQDTIALSKPGGKQVSMTFAVGPTSPGVSSPIYCVYVVPIERRPFTTASSLDDRAITVETSNINLNAPYPVATEAKMLLAQIAAEMHIVYGMPLDTVHILDHSQVYGRGYGSYSTECAGGDLRGAIGWIIAEAQKLVTPPTAKDQDMDYKYYFDGKRSALVHPLYIKDGSITVAGGSADFSYITDVNTPPVGISAAALDSVLGFAKRLYDMAKAERSTIEFDGAINIPAPDNSALEAAVKALPAQIGSAVSAELAKRLAS